MGYAHIDNLYKNKDILNFKECWAMEKVHGTSAHVSWNHLNKKIKYFSGGSQYEQFVGIFNNDHLIEVFSSSFPDKDIILYGEAYGGKMQGMKDTYGPTLKFIVFDIYIDNKYWLTVDDAFEVSNKLGFEFVPFVKIPATVEAMDNEMNKPSRVAVRRGCGNNTDRFGICPPISEGIVVRPIIDVIFQNGKRIVAKHKRHEFSERMTKIKVDDPNQLIILDNAKKIAEEWVTPMRLNHVLDKMGFPKDMTKMGAIIKNMIEDVYRESDNEIIQGPTVQKEISRKTVSLYKEYLMGC